MTDALGSWSEGLGPGKVMPTAWTGPKAACGVGWVGKRASAAVAASLLAMSCMPFGKGLTNALFRSPCRARILYTPLGEMAQPP